MKKYLLAAVLMVGSCSSPKAVYNKDGHFVMQIKRKDSGNALGAAIDDAAEVCENKKQTLMVLDKKTQYYGDLSEEDYIKWQRISRVSSTVGVMHNDVFGDAGMRVGGATQAVIANCGYEAIVTYDCK